MRAIDRLLDKYGESHQNATNKLIHWICVPSIMFSLFGLLFAIPFLTPRTMFFNWAAVLLALALVYYLRLSISMFVGFVAIGLVILWGNNAIYEAVGRDAGHRLRVDGCGARPRRARACGETNRARTSRCRAA